MKKLLTKRVLVPVVFIILLIAVGASIYFYQQYQKTQQLIQNPTLAAQEQTQALLGQVGKLIELPKDETPTIATVSDVTKLQGQPFFESAKNGDKVLIYTKDKKAILYDPVLNIIVNVAPVTLTVTPSVTPSVAITPTKKLTVTPTPIPTKK